MANFESKDNKYLDLESMQTIQKVEDTIHSNFDIFLRVRTLLTTIAYCSIMHQWFLNLTIVNHALTRIKAFIAIRYGTGSNASPAPHDLLY